MRMVTTNILLVCLIAVSAFGCQMLLADPEPFPESAADMSLDRPDRNLAIWDFELTIVRDAGVMIDPTDAAADDAIDSDNHQSDG